MVSIALHEALVLIYEAVHPWLPRRDGKSIHPFIRPFVAVRAAEYSIVQAA